MLLYSLAGIPCMKIPDELIPIFRTPIGFEGPAGIESGIPEAHADPGLYQGELANLVTTSKSPMGVGKAGRPGAHL